MENVPSTKSNRKYKQIYLWMKTEKNYIPFESFEKHIRGKEHFYQKTNKCRSTLTDFKKVREGEKNDFRDRRPEMCQHRQNKKEIDKVVFSSLHRLFAFVKWFVSLLITIDPSRLELDALNALCTNAYEMYEANAFGVVSLFYGFVSIFRKETERKQ